MKKKVVGAILGVCMAFSAFAVAGGLFSVEAPPDILYADEEDMSLPEGVGKYTVTIPKELELFLGSDGTYQCNYTIGVSGMLESHAFVNVTPQSEVTMSADGKEDVQLSVTQDVTQFRSSDYKGELTDSSVKIGSGSNVTGNISVKEGYSLTAGSWGGTLTFDIALNHEVSGKNIIKEGYSEESTVTAVVPQ